MKKFLFFMILCLCLSSAVPARADSVLSGLCGEAFRRCHGLKLLRIPYGSDVGYQAFGSCDGLESVYIEDSAEIGQVCFFRCPAIKNVYVGNDVSLGASSFEKCHSLTNVVFSGNAKLDSYVFADIEGLASFALPSFLESIPSSLFMEDANLREIYIPLSVKTIEDSVFYECSSLSDVYYEGGEAERAGIALDSYHNGALISANWHYEARPEDVSAVTDTSAFDVFSADITAEQGSASAYSSSGLAIEMDTAAVIRDSRTYAPVRYLAEYFGYSVAWDSAEKTVVID